MSVRPHSTGVQGRNSGSQDPGAHQGLEQLGGIVVWQGVCGGAVDKPIVCPNEVLPTKCLVASASFGSQSVQIPRAIGEVCPSHAAVIAWRASAVMWTDFASPYARRGVVLATRLVDSNSNVIGDVQLLGAEKGRAVDLKQWSPYGAVLS